MCTTGLTATIWELIVFNIYCTFLMLTLKIYKEINQTPLQLFHLDSRLRQDQQTEK